MSTSDDAPDNRGEDTPGRVALLVDSPGRDLAGLALLGAELASRGAEVFLVPMNMREQELTAIDPDLVVVNYIRRANQAIVGRLMEAGYDIGLCDTEGGIGIIGQYGSLQDHYGSLLATDPELRDRVRFVSAWGSKVRDRMVEMEWYRADQVVVTGSPRFDFYHRSMWPASFDRLPDLDDDERPLILIIGSFPAANPLFRSAEEEITQRSKHTGYDREVIEELRQSDIDAMNQTVELVRRIAAAHPEANLVFRPHPFERADTYRELFDHDAEVNVRVVSGGTPEAWIVRSAAVVVPNDCTMAVEAAMAGVPALVSSWIVPQNSVEVVERVGYRCHDEAEIVDRVGQIIDGTFPELDDEHRREIDGAIADWFHKADGRGYLRVADLIMANLRRGERSLTKRRQLHHVREGLSARSSGGLQDRLRMLLRLPARFSFRSMGVDDAMGWDSGPKAFFEPDVAAVLGALERHQVLGGTTLSVRRAEAGRDTAFRYQGRSLVVEATPMGSDAARADQAEVGSST